MKFLFLFLPIFILFLIPSATFANISEYGTGCFYNEGNTLIPPSQYKAGNELYTQEVKYYLDEYSSTAILLLFTILFFRLRKLIFRNTIFTNIPKRKLWFYRMISFTYFGWWMVAFYYFLISCGILSYLQIINAGMIFNILSLALVVLLSLTLITLVYKTIYKLNSFLTIFLKPYLNPTIIVILSTIMVLVLLYKLLLYVLLGF